MDNDLDILQSNKAIYKISWIDRFSDWIRNLPGASWLYYSAFCLLLIIGQAIIILIEDGEFINDLHPVQIFLSIGISYLLAIVPYFNNRALAALETIKPALRISEDQYLNLAYRLSKLPGVPTILVSIIAILYVFLSEFIGGGIYQVYELTNYPLSMSISRTLYLVCWWCFATYCYHTIHQLRLINIIYTHHTKIDLFHMNPIYGFSNLTALKAGSVIILPIGFLYLNPNSVSIKDPVVLGSYLIISIIAFLTFILPQLGIHKLQQDERERLLDEINRRYKTTMHEIHKRVDIEKYDEIASLNNALGTLDAERKTVKSFSTWPWQPETIKWLFSAMVLPLLIWITQYFLGQWLNQ